ncbi:MAG: methyltransferase domain-containing protein [Deinococcaceae bacterium]
MIGNSEHLERRFPRLLKHLSPGMSVLDVGCGDGKLTCAIAEHVGPSGSVVGLDIEETAIHRVSTQKVPENVKFVIGDAHHLPYKEQFDLVVARNLLLLLRDPEVALKSMLQAVVSGGKVIVIDIAQQKTRWTPALPSPIEGFRQLFFKWRNTHRSAHPVESFLDVFHKVGLMEVMAIPHTENITHLSASMLQKLQDEALPLVEEGWISLEDYKAIERDFNAWITATPWTMTIHFLTVEGTKSF